MEGHSTLTTDFPDFRDRLQHANLIVSRHNCDEDGLIADGMSKIVQVNQPIRLHRQISHPVTVLLQPLAGVEDGLVLGDRGDDVVPLFFVHLGHALDREIVALSSARRENDLLGGRAQYFGDALPSLLNRLFCGPAKGMITAGCITEFFIEKGQHLFHHPWINGCGGVVVHIDRKRDSLG